MIAWILVGALAMACGFLAFFAHQQLKIVELLRHEFDAAKASDRASYESQIEHLRREKEILFATAMEASRVAVVDPAAAPRLESPVAIENRRRGIERKLAALAARDAEEYRASHVARFRETGGEGLDRDDRVEQQIEAAAEIAAEVAAKTG